MDLRPAAASSSQAGVSEPLPVSDPNSRADAFISYSRHDADFVHRLIRALEERNCNAWLDVEDIPFGTEWEKRIYPAIEQARAFVFVVSPNSVASEMCRRELDHAVKNGKRILPLIRREVDPRELPGSLVAWQWTRFDEAADFDAAVGTLIAAIDTDPQWVDAHTRLLARANEWDRNGRNDGFGLRGAELEEAERWLTQAPTEKPPQPTPLQREYVFASRASATRRQRITRLATGTALVVVSVLAAVAWIQRNDAAFQRDVAVQAQATAVTEAQVRATAQAVAEARRQVALSRQLAAQALADMDSHFDLALLLSLEANHGTDIVEARGSLLHGLLSNPRLTIFLRGHASDVRSVAFSRDGTRLASGGADGTLILWDVAARRQIFPISQGDGRSVNGVAFSPDGTLLASGGRDGEVVLWDAATGQAMDPPLHCDPAVVNTCHVGAVNSVAFSPDGTTLASGGRGEQAPGRGGQVILWDLASRKPLGPPLPHTQEVLSVAFGPDGTTLAVGDRGGKVILWGLTDPLSRRSLDHHTQPVQSVAFSPDGAKVASGSEDRTIVVWDVARGERRGEPLVGHTDQVRSVAFSPDGTRLASGGRDETIRVWDVETGQPSGPPLTGHTRGVLSVAFGPDGRTLASGGRDATVILWDMVAGQPLIGHGDAVSSVAFSPDGARLASGGDDNDKEDKEKNDRDRLVILWDVATGRPIGEPLAGHTRGVLSMAFSPRGTMLASGARDRTVRLWDVATGRLVGQPLGGHPDSVKSVAFSPDGTLLAVGSRDETVRFRDVVTGGLVDELRDHTGNPSFSDPLFSVAFSPDGTKLATGSRGDQGAGRGGQVALWDLASRTLLGPPLAGHADAVNSVALSPDGSTVASGGGDGTVTLSDVARRKPPMRLTGHGSSVESVAFSRPDGTILASGSADRTIRLWDVATGQSLGPPLTGHAAGVTSVAFSPDGKTLASGSVDRSIRLWTIGSESWSGRACSRANRNLTREEWGRYLGDEPYRKTCPDLPGPEE